MYIYKYPKRHDKAFFARGETKTSLNGLPRTLFCVPTWRDKVLFERDEKTRRNKKLKVPVYRDKDFEVLVSGSIANTHAHPHAYTHTSHIHVCVHTHCRTMYAQSYRRH